MNMWIRTIPMADKLTNFFFRFFFCLFYFVFIPVLNHLSYCLFSVTYTSESIFIMYCFSNALLGPRKNWSVWMKKRGRQGELNWLPNVKQVVEQDTEIYTYSWCKTCSALFPICWSVISSTRGTKRSIYKNIPTDQLSIIPFGLSAQNTSLSNLSWPEAFFRRQKPLSIVFCTRDDILGFTSNLWKRHEDNVSLVPAFSRSIR